MNQQFNNDEKAQVGIGTMIVFIATILVAAVAAGVLIDTSQKLQAKSTQTGNAATEQVGNMLQMQAIFGRDDDGSEIDEIEIWVELAAGSEPMNLAEVIVQFKTSSGVTTWSYDDGVQSGANEFVVRGPQTEGSAANDLSDVVLEAGELVKIHIGDANDAGLGADELDLAEGTAVTIDLVPEVGATTSASFSTPDSYGSKTYFELF